MQECLKKLGFIIDSKNILNTYDKQYSSALTFEKIF